MAGESELQKAARLKRTRPRVPPGPHTPSYNRPTKESKYTVYPKMPKGTVLYHGKWYDKNNVVVGSQRSEDSPIESVPAPRRILDAPQTYIPPIKSLDLAKLASLRRRRARQ